MLALHTPTRTHHLPQHPARPQPTPLSFDQLAQQLSAQQLYDPKLLHDYLDSQQPSSAPAVDAAPFMTATYEYSNPAIRIQQSTPTPQQTSGFAPAPMLSTAVDSWAAYSNVQPQTLQTPVSTSARSHHQRASSSSSVGSSTSQYQTVGSAATGYPSFSNLPTHNLPTPTHTPTQDAFMASSNFSNYTPHTSGLDPTMAAHLSMKQALMEQHGTDDDMPGFGHSARHSVSSYDSPATPHTAHDDMDFKMPPNDMRQHAVPKLERTYTDVAADYSFDPNAVVAQSQSQPAANTLLSPYRTSNPNEMIQRHLQAAHMARSQSPSSAASRGDSPFRRGSPFRQQSNAFQSPRMAVGTAAAAREQKAEADAAYAMKSQVRSSEEAQPKTISPKDAMLDFRDADEGNKMALFPQGGASEYDHQYNGGDQYRAAQSNFDTTTQSYRRDSWAQPQFSANFPASVAGTSQPASTFAFAQPSLTSSLQAMSFPPTSSYRPAPSMAVSSEQTPEFPAHLTSMESSCSEAGADPSSQSSERLQKPVNSSADHGTYTCTYHGCTQRFETPQKLQKHKREGHRNAATMSSGLTSSALLERNSQAGPHKCERINPTTGKPCNTIFSRPYDLTRHEDTIHNARKQKVRCALCVEEKTFSRNDALTRHMRVVHPEIDFPGKHRRRGGNHD